ncbi:Guanine nucleotide-binding protein alpha-2 subunit, variant 2 [Exophiala dermatitidis]|nr:Guanine nucleotide-binding protein alpha-2 subunit, variant 2 [Exophiala dermatitidis]KAJ9002874.1 Guanine nucleotide-binding protein alpha-2 subunit, variant 2 [Exophiala dermatitidis]
MKIIHQNGYTQEERALYRLTIYKNLIDCMKALIGGMQQFEIEPEDPTVKDYVEFIMEYNVDPDPDKPLDPKVADAVEAIWKDESASKTMERQSEFYLMDSAPYFFEEVRRIAAPDYIPNEADVLRARTKTTGIYETRFTMGQLSIHMFDVGGQRSERKKWIHCFENVTSIIFCVALSEYDQVLLEESNQNRMMESLVLFDSVVNSRWFMRTSIILFLNKVDLFKEKLGRSPLGNYFPDYSGGNDVNRAAKYLLWRFNQVNRAQLNLYPQYVFCVSCLVAWHLLTCSQSYSGDRHDEYSVGLCRGQRNHPSKCSEGFGDFMRATTSHSFLLCSAFFGRLALACDDGRPWWIWEEFLPMLTFAFDSGVQHVLSPGYLRFVVAAKVFHPLSRLFVLLDQERGTTVTKDILELWHDADGISGGSFCYRLGWLRSIQDRLVGGLSLEDQFSRATVV